MTGLLGSSPFGVLLLVASALIAAVPSAMVIVGVDMRRRHRDTPAGQAVPIAGGVAIVIVLVWVAVMGGVHISPPDEWFGILPAFTLPLSMFFAFSVGLAVVCYPGAWALCLLAERLRGGKGTDWPNLIAAALTCALTVGGVAWIGWFEADVALARSTGSPAAFRRVANECLSGRMPCRLISVALSSPDQETGVLGWIASESRAPRDVEMALVQSGNPDVAKRAAINLNNRPKPDP
jgi:hypothetical protein